MRIPTPYSLFNLGTSLSLASQGVGDGTEPCKAVHCAGTRANASLALEPVQVSDPMGPRDELTWCQIWFYKVSGRVSDEQSPA